MELFEGTQRGEVLGELGSAAHVVQIAAGIERKAREERQEMPRNGAVLVITDRPAGPIDQFEVVLFGIAQDVAVTVFAGGNQRQ